MYTITIQNKNMDFTVRLIDDNGELVGKPFVWVNPTPLRRFKEWVKN